MTPKSLQSLSSVTQTFGDITFAAVIKAMILILIGLFLAKIISAAVGKIFSSRLSPYQYKWLRRLVFYTIFVLFLFAALQHLGFKLNVLLGAAGILTIAIGFASQTSVSNIISGLFLITEKPFVIGDSIKVNNVTGEVLSVDLLSIKIRTVDNTLVRIPNEVFIKSDIINLTKFPIRRFDLQLGIAYKENLGKVKKLLLQIADKNPLCLEEPKPFVMILGFGESAINLQFSVWSTKNNFSDLKNSIQEQVKIDFDEHHIEMPFPQMAISTASVTEPFPVIISKQ